METEPFGPARALRWDATSIRAPGMGAKWKVKAMEGWGVGVTAADLQAVPISVQLRLWRRENAPLSSAISTALPRATNPSANGSSHSTQTLGERLDRTFSSCNGDGRLGNLSSMASELDFSRCARASTGTSIE